MLASVATVVASYDSEIAAALLGSKVVADVADLTGLEAAVPFASASFALSSATTEGMIMRKCK